MKEALEGAFRGKAKQNEGSCVAVCCSVLQCVAVCCSVLQCVAVVAPPKKSSFGP